MGQKRIEALNFWPTRLGEGQTLPQGFECDDGGYWVLKLKGSPGAATWELCADWIGTALAALAKVPVMDCTLVHVGIQALWTLPDAAAQWARPGTAFGSAFLTQARPVTGPQAIEMGLSPLDMVRTIAVDTWLDVLDRKKPLRGGWNLLEDTSTAPPRVVVIDYGFALSEVIGPPILGDQQAMQLRAPDEWLAWLKEAHIAQAVGDVLAIPREHVQAVVDAVPEDWRSDVPGLREVPAYLLRRRTELEACLRRELDHVVRGA